MTVEQTGRWFAKRRRTLRAGQVVVAAGTWGTQNLLHRMKASGAIPQLSDALGERTRTNSEAIVGSGRTRRDPNTDSSSGIGNTSRFAISSWPLLRSTITHRLSRCFWPAYITASQIGPSCSSPSPVRQ